MVNHFWSHFGCWDIWIWISRRNFKSIQIWLNFNRPFPQNKTHNPNKRIGLQCTLQCKQTITQKQFSYSKGTIYWYFKNYWKYRGWGWEWQPGENHPVHSRAETLKSVYFQNSFSISIFTYLSNQIDFRNGSPFKMSLLDMFFWWNGLFPIYRCIKMPNYANMRVSFNLTHPVLWCYIRILRFCHQLFEVPFYVCYACIS